MSKRFNKCFFGNVNSSSFTFRVPTVVTLITMKNLYKFISLDIIW